MSHQLSSDAVRLPVSLISSASTYSLSSSMSYPSSLLAIPSSTSSHQLVSPTVSSISSSSFHNSQLQHQQQSISTHQLPPTPNSLITIMGPNSGSSNSPSDHLTNAEVSTGSISPSQHSLHQQQQPQQINLTPTSWSSLPIGSDANSSSSRISNLASPTSGPSSLTGGLPQATPHLHSSHQHQAFNGHYTQNFQQPRTTAHQFFYNWYN